MSTTSPEQPRILIVEDDPGLRTQLRWALSDYEVFLAGDRAEAIAIFRREEPQIVLLDLGLPPDRDNASEGLAVLRTIHSFRPHTKIIIASANQERGNALEAVRSGAYDFFGKPVDPEILKIIISRAWNGFQIEDELEHLRAGLEPGQDFSGLIAACPEMRRACHLAERVAPTDIGVLITGESGTGKDVLARAIHAWSPRRDAPFIAINCAAIPENLLESELFGHEKGAFTGAVTQVIGKFEQAHKGTIFLDEIGDMPFSLQAKLLRFLQEKTIERVGGRKAMAVDVRVISATNRDLRAMMAEGRFRDDLYYRLDEISIALPPLREREGDVVLIASYLLNKLGERLDRRVKGFTREALTRILSHPWPGNVRELENRLKRAIVLADQGYITVEDLDLGERPNQNGDPTLPTLRQVREEAERGAICRTLAVAENNVQEASKILGVSRPTLYSMMKALRIHKTKAGS